MSNSSHELIATRGYWLTSITLPPSLRASVIAREWSEVDAAIAQETKAGGSIFEEMRKHADFSQIEFILSIRSSLEFPDEDGIWHDDGSRVLAFSLSLTLNSSEIQGGNLEIRKRSAPDSESQSIPTPEWGNLIIFATGHQNFEHKINRVTQGERIIAAGWCT